MKTLRAILISPLIAFPVTAIVALIFSRGQTGAVWWALSAWYFILATSYAGLLVLGIPYTYILGKCGTRHPVPLVVGAVVLGVTIGYAGAAILLDKDNVIGHIAFVVMGAVSSGAVSLVYWWLSGSAAQYVKDSSAVLRDNGQERMGRTDSALPSDSSTSTHTTFARSTRWKLLLVLWLASCIAVLANFLMHTSEPNAGAALLLFMVALTLPSGILTTIIVGAAATQAGMSATSDAVSWMVCYWIACVATGYFQWFVLLPTLRRRLNKPQPAEVVARSKGSRIRLTLWLLACVAVLVNSFVQKGDPGVEGSVLFFMVLLTFPIGFFTLVLVGVVGVTMGIATTSGSPWAVFTWATCVATGYFQWFVLIPKVARYFEKRRTLKLKKRKEAGHGR